jgi:hypothetical protein
MNPHPNGTRRRSGSSGGTRTAIRSATLAWVAQLDCPKNQPVIGAPPSDRGELPSGRRNFSSGSNV